MPTEEKTKNKGEWSEFYTFAYLLRFGFLQAADKNLNPIENIRYPLVKITREEIANKPIDYYPGENIGIRRNGVEIASIPLEVFEKAVPEIFKSIKDGDKNNPPGRKLMEKCLCKKVSASNSEKKDLFIQAHDPRTGQEPQMGFSIKSYVGGPPTLFNAEKDLTNFVYDVTGCTDSVMTAVNGINDKQKKIIKRMARLTDAGCDLRYEKMASSSFYDNLIMIESRLPEILGEMMRISFLRNILNVSELVTVMENEDPLGIGRKGFYTQKIRNFLKDVALGMTPKKKWNGEEDANGGYVAVKNDGSVVCYFVYDRVGFMDYLLAHTRLERPSTTRHEYAMIWKTIDGEYKMKLNLQVRFTD